MKKTTQTTQTTKVNSITLTKLGEFIKEYATGKSTLTLTEKSFTKYGVTLPTTVIPFIEKFYIAIGNMMDLRQSCPNSEELKASEQLVKKLSDNWLKMVGTRKSKNLKSNELRPCYCTTYADYAILGECVGNALTLVNNDLTKVINKFTEILFINTARILNGEKPGRVTESQIKQAKTETNKIKAEKAKVTRENNKAKKDSKNSKIESLNAELEILRSQNAELLQSSIDIKQLVKLIKESDASEAHKNKIINFVLGNKK